jgi:hypothetical protein
MSKNSRKQSKEENDSSSEDSGFREVRNVDISYLIANFDDFEIVDLMDGNKWESTITIQVVFECEKDGEILRAVIGENDRVNFDAGTYVTRGVFDYVNTKREGRIQVDPIKGNRSKDEILLSLAHFTDEKVRSFIVNFCRKFKSFCLKSNKKKENVFTTGRSAPGFGPVKNLEDNLKIPIMVPKPRGNSSVVKPSLKDEFREDDMRMIKITLPYYNARVTQERKRSSKDFSPKGMLDNLAFDEIPEGNTWPFFSVEELSNDLYDVTHHTQKTGYYLIPSLVDGQTCYQSPPQMVTRYNMHQIITTKSVIMPTVKFTITKSDTNLFKGINMRMELDQGLIDTEPYSPPRKSVKESKSASALARARDMRRRSDIIASTFDEDDPSETDDVQLRKAHNMEGFDDDNRSSDEMGSEENRSVKKSDREKHKKDSESEQSDASEVKKPRKNHKKKDSESEQSDASEVKKPRKNKKPKKDSESEQSDASEVKKPRKNKNPKKDSESEQSDASEVKKPRKNKNPKKDSESEDSDASEVKKPRKNKKPKKDSESEQSDASEVNKKPRKNHKKKDSESEQSDASEVNKKPRKNHKKDSESEDSDDGPPRRRRNRKVESSDSDSD